MNEDVIVPEVEDDSFNLEVVDTTEIPEKDQAYIDLETKLAEQTAELERLKAVPPQAPTDPGLRELAEAIKASTLKKDEPKKPQAQVDLAKLIEEKNAEFYKNPGQSVYELITPVLQQMKAETSQEVLSLKVANSKLSALSSDDNKLLYGKYSDEVEQIAKTLPQDANVYQNALNQVKMNHFQELVQEQAQTLAQSLITEQTQKVEEEAKQMASGASFTNAGAPATPKPRKVQITPAQKQAIDNWMLTKGYTVGDPGDTEFAVNYFKTKGWIK